MMGEQHFVYELVEDSMSSLKWSRAEYTKSCIVRNASNNLLLLAIKADAWLNGTTHIAGKQNIVCDDGLSRNSSFVHVTLPVHLK
jgi:hypothetical protein